MTLRRVLLPLVACMVLFVGAPAGEPSRTGPLDEELRELTEQLRRTSRQLWRESIEAPPELPEPSRLLERVGEIRRLRLEPEDARRRLDDAQAEATPAEGPTTRPVRRTRSAPTWEEPVSEEVLAQIQASAPSDPAQAARLADTLFTDGHLQAAYAVYEAALQRETSEQRAAWLVFQMANCKKDSDPEQARNLYGQLIAEYPDSRWAEPAKVQDRILQWKQANDPESALSEARRTAETSPR